MNLQKAVKILSGVFKDWKLDFEVVHEAGDKRVKATGEFTISGHDDHVFARFSFYESGVSEYRFIFDKLTKTANTLQLVNAFNSETPWFKAFIDDDYLNVSHVVCYMTEDALAEYTERVLSNLVDDDVKEFLVPLTKLTTD